MPQPDYYKILQLDPEAEQEIVKVVHRKLSLKYHPDGTEPDPDKMRLLNEAHEVIGETARRKRYNAHRQYERDGLAAQPARPPSYWNPPTQPFTGSRATPRRRYRYGIAPGTFTIFGALAILAFAAVMLQALSSGTESPVSSSALTQTIAPTAIPVFGVSALAAEARLEELGFTFPENLGPDGQIGGANEATDSFAAIAAENGVDLEWFSLDLQRNSETTAEMRTAQDAQIDGMLTLVLTNDAARQQIALWIGAWDGLTTSHAEFKVEGVLVEAAVDPESGTITIKTSPAP